MNIRIWKSIAMATGVLGLLATTALSEVKLPSTAKLLTKAEIISAYGGTTSKWEHPNSDKLIGTAVLNKEMTAAKGTWASGKDKGNWESKITFKGDQYCWATRIEKSKKFNKPVCNIIYLDGKVAYELDPKTKKILSVNTIQ